jgi:hypothetical protein
MRTLGVLSSYFYGPVQPGDSGTVQGLVAGLREEGFERGRDYRLELSHTNDLEEHRAALEGWKRQGIDLIFSGGTPGAAVVREVYGEMREVPLVYFGAHPDDAGHEIGLERCMGPNTVCVRIELPLTYSHRNFRLLKQLFPELEDVYIPFARNTVFCHPEMAAKYDRALERSGPAAWLHGREVGFGSLVDLCWLIDTEYHEHPLRSAWDLEQALEQIPERRPGEPVTAAVLAFNDTYHVAGSPQTLVAFSQRSGVPLVWINNARMAEVGAVADFCNDFRSVARHSTRFIARHLRGEIPPGHQHVEWDHDVTFSLDLGRLESLGIEIPRSQRLLRHFHRILPASDKGVREERATG